ncbi:MAG: DUF401 family protein [Candidatus Asgardarchaeia archaeon]
MYNEAYTTIAFLLSLAVLLYLSRKNIGVAIFVSSTLLCLLTSTPLSLFKEIMTTFTNIENITLSLAVGIMPIVGEILNSSGMLESLIERFRGKEKELLIASPALLSLLPMPGGALFSAPMVEKCSKDLDHDRKAGINVWFRHVVHLIYPLSPDLIIACELAGIYIYDSIVFLIPYFVIVLVFGMLYLINDVKMNESSSKESQVKSNEYLKPLLVLIVAPSLDYTLKTFFGLNSIATLIAISFSLFLALNFGKISFDHILKSIKRAKPWNFSFMIMAIYLYQSVFKISGMPQIIESFNISELLFLIVPGFVLGVLTGRVSTPLLILIPIYLTKFGIISPLNLAAIYYFTFLGYLVSPVHPCLAVSSEYFKVKTKNLIKVLMKAIIASFLLGLVYLLLMSLFV